MKLNLGAGSFQPPGYVHVDIAAVDGIDVVHDLDVTPWPWPDSTVEEILARDVFEHVDNAVAFMVESHRVLAPGGQLVMQTPYWRSETAFTDPTHRRFPTPHTWDYWVPGTVLYRSHNAAYGGVAFQVANFKVGDAINITLRKPRTAP